MTTYQQAIVDGARIFYREAGPKDRPYDPASAWLSHVVPHVSQPHPSLG